MRFQVGRVDHDPARLACFACQLGEYLVEHAKTAPTHKPIVDRLVRTVGARRVSPTQAVLENKDDSADHPPVIHPRNPVRQRKIRRDTAHLRLRKHKQIVHGDTSVCGAIESIDHSARKTFNGS